MVESEHYAGPERRAANLKLDEALAEVQRLHNAATTLANAVANTAHRSELEELRFEVHRENRLRIYASLGFTIVAVIILFITISFKISNLNKSIKHGHSVINCMQGKSELQRTGDLFATALVTCEQTAR